MCTAIVLTAALLVLDRVLKLLAYRDLLGDQVDEQSVGRAVRDMLQKSNEYIPSPSVIISYICKYFSVEEDVLRGQRRGRNEVNARQIASSAA